MTLLYHISYLLSSLLLDLFLYSHKHNPHKLQNKCLFQVQNKSSIVSKCEQFMHTGHLTFAWSTPPFSSQSQKMRAKLLTPCETLLSL